MNARDPVINPLRRLLDAPNSIPDLKTKPPKPPEIPSPTPIPDFLMRELLPIVPSLPGYNPYVPGRLYRLDPNQPLRPEINPYIPREPPSFAPVPNRLPPSAPDRAPPAVPDRLPTVGSVEPPIRPIASHAPHWLALSIPPVDWASQPPSPPPVSDVPSWLDPGPVGKALRRVLGFPE
jgi:hypothetical protein